MYKWLKPTYDSFKQPIWRACKQHTCMMTKLPIKQYKKHTTIKLHGKTIHTMVLARSSQDHASPSKFGKIHQCGTTQFNFYIGGTDPCSPALKVRNRVV